MVTTEIDKAKKVIKELKVMGPQFKIGHKFIRRNTQRKDVETITDTNNAGETVSVVYVASHDFMGSIVTDIARSIMK